MKEKRENKICACGGTSVFYKTMHLDTVLNVDGFLTLDMYICEACGKVEFYQPKLEIKSAAEQLEEKYRTYSDKKLEKIAEDTSYREDARTLAQRILAERSGESKEG